MHPGRLVSRGCGVGKEATKEPGCGRRVTGKRVGTEGKQAKPAAARAAGEEGRRTLWI